MRRVHQNTAAGERWSRRALTPVADSELRLAAPAWGQAGSTVDRIRSTRSLLATLFVLLGIGFGLQAVWIPAKAQVAQVLLHNAWMRARAGETEARPWPWADTWPVARLRAPRQDADLIVLAGASGEALAFGPGHISGTAAPGQCGHCAVSGHRDTHFRFLAELAVGDPLELESPDGRVQRFTVAATRIVDRSRGDLLDDGPAALLTLVTCYPFDAIVPGGPLRYVVQAELVEVDGACAPPADGPNAPPSRPCDGGAISPPATGALAAVSATRLCASAKDYSMVKTATASSPAPATYR